MEYDRTTTIEDFLNATAARQPAPGGGSVAALAGALSSAMGQMVLSYSIGKKSLLQFEGALQKAAGELDRAREVLLQLMVEDQHAYSQLTALRKLPEDSADRQAKMPALVLACVQVPQLVGTTAVAILEICEQVVGIINPWLLSDLAVCADLAMATARSASYNVKVNLSSVEDFADRKRLEAQTEAMLQHAKHLIQQVSPRIWSRHDQAD